MLLVRGRIDGDVMSRTTGHDMRVWSVLCSLDGVLLHLACYIQQLEFWCLEGSTLSPHHTRAEHCWFIVMTKRATGEGRSSMRS